MSVQLTSEQQQFINVLEDTYLLLQKTQTNLKKCPKQRLTRGYLDTKSKCIEDYWKTFKSAHQALTKCTPKESRGEISYFLNEDYFVVEDLYTCLQADLKDMLEPQMSPNTSSNTSHIQEPFVKLPRIELPTFNGNYEDWPTFRDMFMSLVHCNTSLSKVQKLQYLKSSVVGECESLLKHINVTENNYEQAWNILSQRYGNKRLIVNSSLKKLFNQKKISTASSVHLKNLLDTTTQCLNNLKNQEIPIDTWDQIIIFTVVQKLDADTHRAWEEYSYQEDSNKLAEWRDLKKFLETKFRTLEMVSPLSVKEKIPVKEKTFHASTEVKKYNCTMCHADHTLCHCKDFSKLQPKERSEFVKKNRLCFNCLMSGHSVGECHNQMSCRKCNRRHHTLLHQTINDGQPSTVKTHHNQYQEHESDQPEELTNSNQHNEDQVAISTHFASQGSTALLATALLPVKNADGQIILLRALIDQGSQANFISERAAQLLKCKRSPVKGTITGVGTTHTIVRHMTQVELNSSHDEQFKLPIKAYIMPTRLTSQLPTKTLPSIHTTWQHLRGITLADPSFNSPGRIDMLLGVEVYAHILKPEILKGPPGSPCAQNTSLGWILFGNIQAETSNERILVMHHQLDVDDMLRNLWEIETDTKGKLTKEEEFCEEFYKKTLKRDTDGRYIVKLPFKIDQPLSPNGNTREGAVKRLQQLERRFNKDQDLKKEYAKAMQEYIDLKHMEVVPPQEMNNPAVYLPHHAVVKEESETTKVRPVFDASYKGTNNISLNDELLIGPQLQDDMRSIVLRWRMKRIAFVADIQKMYRQILVAKEDSDYQRIVWRSDSDKEIKDYRMLRVTFGTACAPYLAVKTLQQVAEDEGSEHPLAADIIKRDFFMDDMLSSLDNEDQAVAVAKSVQAILQKGGFHLQKWASNSEHFLKQFETSERSSRVNIDIKFEGMIKTLGLHWNIGEDILQYNLKLPNLPISITKRTILAEIQRLFDPLGWLSPALIQAKILIQKLWLQGIGWDDEVDSETKEEWLSIRNSFNNIQDIKINRWLNTTDANVENATIHGYCDASVKAYGAVAYLRVESEDGEPKAYMIAAKARVAPVKSLSLPRLELCGALLLSKLLKQISEATSIPTNRIFCWTDSTIVLSWLQGDPNRWQTFVRNRVIAILDNIGNKWYHIPSEHNPADVASRGMLAQELKSCSIWWQGPDHLKQKEIIMERLVTNDNSLEERKNIKTYHNLDDNDESKSKTIYDKIDTFETLNELLKTIVYAKRFLNYRRNDKHNIDSAMTTKEIEEALMFCIQLTQAYTFPEDIQDLKEKKGVKQRSTLKTLNPFIDAKNILRVGGRITKTDIEEDRKHPIILSSKNPLTSLIIADAHKRTLHGGVQLMMNYLGSRYWIQKVRSAVRSYVHKCIVCRKLNSKTRTQLMGDLPKVRLTPARPFLRSGVDFAGPYDVLMSKGRGAKTNKSYIAIFVCMATKAIHLELVGNLTSEAFIGAFRRFVARRGRCSDIWSDQGRNFVGANKELAEAFKQANFEIDAELRSVLSSDGTQWHFIPAYSPNFGGLWEAGVKSMKYHLKRIVDTNFTFEEMTTILCQVEACLNSRPLCPVDTDDPDNTDVLTPGHFLIGEPLITIPSPSLKDISLTNLSRWQFTQKLVSNFWRRWQQEYLSRLQQRPKWVKRREEFDIGQIVVIKTDGLPPGKWLLGRIVDKHPGADGITRVYSVKSGTNVIKRSISKLCHLPVDNNED